MSDRLKMINNKNSNVGSWLKGCFSSPVISVLHLSGVIRKQGNLGLSIDALNKHIEKAFSFKKLQAVCLFINSPGGSPVQSELIASRIISLSKKHDVPVYSFIQDVAASGGYWLACAGEKIFASADSIIGSIGVVRSSFGFVEAIKKLGIERRIQAEGENKVILDPFLPEKESDLMISQHLQKQIHESFIEYVTQRRQNLLSKEINLFDGKFWTGKDSLQLGLVDKLTDFYTFVQEEFGSKITIKHIKQENHWLKRKFGLAIDTDIVDDAISKIYESVLLSRFL